MNVLPSKDTGICGFFYILAAMPTFNYGNRMAPKILACKKATD
jgi:hypothetical protein